MDVPPPIEAVVRQSIEKLGARPQAWDAGPG